MVNAQSWIDPDSGSGLKVQNLIRLYRILYSGKNTDGVAMRQWLCRWHPRFKLTPHLLLVDEGRLTDFVEYLFSTEKIED